MNIRIAAEDVSTLQDILQSGKDRILLKLLRDEATTCVLMVRMINEERKAEWAKREAERAAEERALEQWLAEDNIFGDVD